MKFWFTYNSSKGQRSTIILAHEEPLQDYFVEFGISPPGQEPVKLQTEPHTTLEDKIAICLKENDIGNFHIQWHVVTAYLHQQQKVGILASGCGTHHLSLMLVAYINTLQHTQDKHKDKCIIYSSDNPNNFLQIICNDYEYIYGFL